MAVEELSCGYPHLVGEQQGRAPVVQTAHGELVDFPGKARNPDAPVEKPRRAVDASDLTAADPGGPTLKLLFDR